MMKSVEVYRDYGSVEVSVIESFEREMNCDLPLEYKKLLTMHNALWLEKRDFVFQVNGEDDSRDVIFFGYGDGLKKSLKIELSQQDECCHESIIVIGESANGDFICFDYRENSATNNPPVVVMFHDYLDENNKMLICPVADNFEQFLDLLYKGDEG
jgi:hypothetical protein